MSGHAQAVTFAAGLVKGGPGFLAGFTLAETAGSTAAIRLYDNASAASGNILATLKFAANDSKYFVADSGGVWFQNGVYAQVVSGTVEGSVFIG